MAPHYPSGFLFYSFAEHPRYSFWKVDRILVTKLCPSVWFISNKTHMIRLFRWLNWKQWQKMEKWRKVYDILESQFRKQWVGSKKGENLRKRCSKNVEGVHFHHKLCQLPLWNAYIVWCQNGDLNQNIDTKTLHEKNIYSLLVPFWETGIRVLDGDLFMASLQVTIKNFFSCTLCCEIG